MTTKEQAQNQNASMDEARYRLMRALIAVRLLVVSAALAAGYFFYSLHGAFFGVVALCYAVNFANLILLRYRSRLPLVAEIQLVVDVILTTALVHYTGGIDSVFVFFYPLCILAASVAGSSPVFSQTITFACALFFGLLVALEYSGVLDTYAGSHSSYEKGFWLVAFLYFFRILIFGFVNGMGMLLVKHLGVGPGGQRGLQDMDANLLGRAQHGVITADGKDRIIYANERAAEILGCCLHELIGKNWRELFEEGVLCVAKTEALPAVLGTDKSEMHLVISCPDGSEKILGLHFSQQFDEKDALVSKVILFRDLTEVMRMEKKLKAAEKWALLGELAAGIVHEIRNPLSSMRGAVEVLKERKVFDGKDVALLDIVLSESDRLNRILQDYLVYSQKKSTERKNCDLAEIVGHLLRMIQTHPRLRKDVSLHWDSSQCHGVVCVDDEQIRQVLLNVIVNALEAMPQGGDLFLRLNCTAEIPGGRITPLGHWLRLDIQDTGVGMSSEVLDRLYEPFFSTKQDGHGIGLALCRRIVEAHQGFIQAQSELGKGTTFSIYLPAVSDALGHSHGMASSGGGYG